MAAFRTAVADGADWLEMDVQRSRDGALVVFHDATIDRVTNGTGRVADLTLREIVGLKVGGRERVPTFAEVLAFATQAGVRILPEAKNPELYPGIEVEIVRMLRDAGYLGKAVVQSFNHTVLENLRRIDPDVQVCPLYRLWHLSLTRPRPERRAIRLPDGRDGNRESVDDQAGARSRAESVRLVRRD